MRSILTHSSSLVVIFPITYIVSLFYILWLLQHEEVLFFQTLAATHMDDKELIESIQKLLIVMQRLDDKIAPLLELDGELFNKRYCGACSCQFFVFLVLCLCLLGCMCLLFQNMKLDFNQWLPYHLSGGGFSLEQACGTKATWWDKLRSTWTYLSLLLPLSLFKFNIWVMPRVLMILFYCKIIAEKCKKSKRVERKCNKVKR